MRWGCLDRCEYVRFFAPRVCALLRVCEWLNAAVCVVAGVGAFMVTSRSVVTVHLIMWLRLRVGRALGARRV